MNDFITALIGWASLFSGYDRPAHDIEVQYVPPAFFHENMCGGAKCLVFGGYFDAEAPNTLYIEERFVDDKSLYAASFIVHEATHALQHYSGDFDSDSCDDSLKRERQAYFVQNEFLIANGHPPILHMTHGSCAK